MTIYCAEQVVQEFDWGKITWLKGPKNSMCGLAVAVVSLGPRKRLSAHVHSHEEQVITVLSGRGRQVIDGEETPLLPGVILQLPVGCTHEMINDGDQPLVFQVVYDPVIMPEDASTSRPAMMLAGILEMRLGSGCSFDQCYSEVELAKNYIQHHFRENIKLNDVARAVACSPSHLSRLFKKKTGKTVMQHLAEVRVNAAMQLIAQSGFTVNTAAEAVGFQSPRYFRAVFKKIKGTSPGKYKSSPARG